MTPATTDRLRLFAELLLRWNGKLNLVASRDAGMLWDRHILDSLQLGSLIPAGTQRAIDLGTGAGFPGLILAIATGIPFDLIEADRRKAAFLRTAIRETAAPAVVHAERIEDATLPPASVITARALAPLTRLLPLAVRLLSPGGLCLLLKGGKTQEELRAVEADWSMTVRRIPSATHDDGVILHITDLQFRRTIPI